jgi:beta-lactamase superfamily II metal-dependent hydrolase
MSHKEKKKGTLKPRKLSSTRSDVGNESSGKNSTGKIIIRMYNVGFGDSFLIIIRTKEKLKKILFDCGSIKKGNKPIAEIVERIIADVTDPDGVPRLDLVVATHRHRDHVSGFDNPAWADVEVKEVWMPWTEHPSDPEAKRIRDTQSRLALALSQALTPAVAVSVDASIALELSTNALTNEAAMDTLHNGFAGQPQRRFLPESGARNGMSAVVAQEVCPEATIYALGPSRDPEVIRDMDPPAGRSYLRLLDSLDAQGKIPEPFSQDWWMLPTEYSAGNFNLLVADSDKAKLQQFSISSQQAIAVSLDKAVNGTSLVLLLKIGKHHLLFPGDAQWGSWRAILESEEWRDMLKRIKFLKIGHHGSHNATPKQFVEEIMGEQVVAMASTHRVAQWPDIPKPELLEAMAAKNVSMARSDEEAEAPAQFQVEPGIFIETTLPL